MSQIEVTHGSAVVTVSSLYDSHPGEGDRTTFPHYRPVDVLDAACAALLAINTPDAVTLAGRVFELTALNLGPRRTPPREDT